MEAWLIILITISSGLAIFTIAMVLKNRKKKHQPNAFTAPVMISNANVVQSTNRSPAFNTGNPPTTVQYTVHHTNVPVFSSIPPAYQGHPHMMQTQQVYINPGLHQQQIHPANSFVPRVAASPAFR